MSLSSRLQKLEKAANRGGQLIVLVEQYEGEPIEAVEERWKQEHPGEDIEAAALRVVIRKFA